MSEYDETETTCVCLKCGRDLHPACVVLNATHDEVKAFHNLAHLRQQYREELMFLRRAFTFAATTSISIAHVDRVIQIVNRIGECAARVNAPVNLPLLSEIETK